MSINSKAKKVDNRSNHVSFCNSDYGIIGCYKGTPCCISRNEDDTFRITNYFKDESERVLKQEFPRVLIRVYNDFTNPYMPVYITDTEVLKNSNGELFTVEVLK